MFQAEKYHWSNETWGYFTVGAAIAAGVGFIMQFMGLRGLTYPCSIAQLVATILMAFVRATIRRRLGRELSYCPAFARFEIDSLATRSILRDIQKLPRAFGGRHEAFEETGSAGATLLESENCRG